jgi:2-oxoisovalerate dehydrogenase E1 component
MTPISSTTRGGDLVSRGIGLGIESHVVDGLDPFAVEKAVANAAEMCRRGEGPVLLECKTIRLKGHYNKDIEHYRPKADQEAAAAADPIVRLRELALDHGLLEEAEPAQIEQAVRSIVDDATSAVRAMPLPDPATVFDHLYGNAPMQQAATGPVENLELTFQRAVNLALKIELENRPEMLVYGEDVGFAGGIFGVSRGLQKEFGAGRVFDTPISESAILGSAVGAAMEGMRPVVEIMWADFVFVALDQIINQATNVRYINRAKLHAPLTIRMQQGVTPGSCA